jgi:hypothetical protein
MSGGIHAVIYFLGILPDYRQKSLGMKALEHAPHHIGPAVRGAEATMHYANVSLSEAAAIEARNEWHQMIVQGSTVGMEPADPSLRAHFAWIPEEHWQQPT